MVAASKFRQLRQVYVSKGALTPCGRVVLRRETKLTGKHLLIARKMNCSPSTVARVLAAYRADGTASFAIKWSTGRPRTVSSPFAMKKLKVILDKNPPSKTVI